MSTTTRAVQFIEVRGLTRAFRTPGGDFTALRDVELLLPRGEFVAVVGKSGSGKSTLLNLIAGIDQPSAGEIRVGETRVHAFGESELAAWRGRNVGVVFQFFQLLPTLTVLENVTLPMDLCHTLPPTKARARALELLQKVGIADQAAKFPAALSGGQQQRAAIARAMANDPQLIVADEPTGNLDSQTAGEVLELLASLTRAGTTVLMVTHERDVTRVADRVVTLSDGRVESCVVRAQRAEAANA